MGNTRKIWTDSNCRILLLPIHKYFSDVLKTREEFFISQIEDCISSNLVERISEKQKLQYLYNINII